MEISDAIDKRNEEAEKENLPTICFNGTSYWLKQGDAVYYAVSPTRGFDIEKVVACVAIYKKGLKYEERRLITSTLPTMAFDSEKGVIEAQEVAIEAIRDYRKKELEKIEVIKRKNPWIRWSTK